MWRQSSNSGSVKPDKVDKTTSKYFVYVRKDFKEVPTLDEDGNEIGTHWEYLEDKVPVENWTTRELEMINESNIDYISAMTGVEL